MTDKECLFTYQELVALLVDEGKEWLIEQVENQIHQGKIRQVENVETVKIRQDSKQLSLFETKDPTAPLFERGRRASFLAVSDYTPSEQLLLLIDSMIINAFNRINVEERVLTYFHHHLQTDTVTLYLDREEREIASFHLDDLRGRREQIELLIQHLKHLRDEVSNEHS